MSRLYSHSSAQMPDILIKEAIQMKKEYLKPESLFTLSKAEAICNSDNFASANGLFEDPNLTEEDYD